MTCATRFGWLAGFLALCFSAPGQTANPPCHPVSLEQGETACLTYADGLGENDVANLGRDLEIRGAYKTALQVYRRALTQTPKNIALQKGYLRSRSELKARRLLVGLKKTAPQKIASPCLTTRWAQAVEACRKEIAQDPNNPQWHHRLGDALRSVGRPHAALKAYRESFRLKPDSVPRQKIETLTLLVNIEPQSGPLLVQGELKHQKIATTTSVSVEKTSVKTESMDVPPRSLPAVAQVPLTKDTPANVTRKPALPIEVRGEFKALLIGNQRYKHFPVLRSPVNDVRAIADVLTNRYGFDVTQTIDASRYEIFQALAKLRRETKPDDSVLVYYAGHGYLDEVTSRGYWLPVDSENDNAANWISTSDITDLLAGLPARHVLVVADSCFSGALVRSGTGIELDGRQTLLKRLYASRSRSILTSGGLEPVLDGGSSKHSVFAFSLLEALNRNTGVIEAERLFVSIRDRVSFAAEQVPQYGPLRGAGHEGGDFVFVPKNLRSP